MIENVTEADLGLYYCSMVEKKMIEHNKLMLQKEVYHISNTLIKLTYAGPIDTECSGSSGKCSRFVRLFILNNEIIL